MANFKTNASRKRWLDLQKKKKYAVGGLSDISQSGTSMYGQNTMPGVSTASLVYDQSSPEYQAQLQQEIQDITTDTSYHQDAIDVLNKQDKIEGYAQQVGRKGVNKLVEKAYEQGYEGMDMGERPGQLLKTGWDAAKRQRELNLIAKGGAKGVKTLQKAKTTTDLLEGLSTYGTQASSSALKAGTSAIKSGAGVGTVGALMAAGGDKWYDKVTNDQTLEGRADFTGEEKAASLVRGAGAGIGAVSTGAALGTMLGVGAANAWNPIGWATLAAAGIGAGVTAINRSRKAKKAGEEFDKVEGQREADINQRKRLQRLDALKDKQYSGFDYGGDYQGPGFYGKTGGIKKYQTEGVSESDLPQTDLYQSVQPWTKGKLFKGDNNWAKAANWLSGDQITRELVDSVASTRDASDEYTGVNQDFSTWQSEQEANDAWSPMLDDGITPNPNFNPQLATGTDPYDVYQDQAESTMPWNFGIGYGGGNFNIGVKSPYKHKLPFVDHEVRIGGTVGTDMFKPGAWSAEGDYGSKLPWNWFGRTGGIRPSGVKKYQTTGVQTIGPYEGMVPTGNPGEFRPSSEGYRDPFLETWQNDEGEGTFNPWVYNPSYLNQAVRDINKRGSSVPEGARYINPDNIFTASSNITPEQWEQIQEFQGAYPLGEAEVVADFEPRNSQEANIFKLQGMDGVLRHRQNKSETSAAVNQAGAWALTPLAVAGGLEAGGAVAASSAGPAIGQGLRWAGGKLLRPTTGQFRTGSNLLKNAWMNPNNAGLASRGWQGFKGGMNIWSGTMVPGAQASLAGFTPKALSGQAGFNDYIHAGEDMLTANPYSSILGRAWKYNPFTLNESGRIAEDVASQDWESLAIRVPTSLPKGEQGTWGDKLANLGLMTRYMHGSEPGGAEHNLKVGQRDILKADTDPLKLGGMRQLPGGKAVDIGTGATKYVGQTHAQGGIMADAKSEVENNEVEKDVTLADGSMNPYIYSEYLNMDGSKGYKTGGISIADKAEELARTGAPQSTFDALATMQEKAAGRTGNKIMNTAMAKYGGFQNTSTNYQKGGVTNYQTRGLVMSKERQEQFDNLIQWVPNVGYVGPDGTNYGFNEADVVDFVNRGGLDSYNPNAPETYMPSGEAMEQYAFEDRQQAFRDALRGANQNQPVDPNESVADPNFQVGQQGDLVVPPGPGPIEMLSLEERVKQMNQFNANNPPPPPPTEDEVAEEVVEEVVEPTTSTNTQGGGKTYDSPFDTKEEEREFQDWANDQGVNTRGYGWGKYSDAAWNQLKDQWASRDESVDMTGFDNRERQGFEGTYTSGNDAAADLAAANDAFVGPVIPDWAKDLGTALSPEESAKANKRLEELRGNKNKSKWRTKYEDEKAAKKGTLLKAAQFIPAAMAFMDKPDYMSKPERVGGVPRVNLENVSLDDRQNVINADNAAMQRFISNAGMGTAGFAARMAAWNKKEGLSAAVTAEEQRLNTQINNSEAQMNAEVEARNRMIQAQNRDADMQVDRFNTESEAATKAQRVDAMANATAGLLTQWMDQKMLDTQERVGANISGETGVLQRENFNLLTQKYNLVPGTDDYKTFEDNYWASQNKKKKFGGMRQLPRYGYSTK